LSPAVSCTRIIDSEKHKLFSVGRPLDHTEIKIVDPKTGNIKPIDEPGEILVRGYNTFIGYWKDEDKTKEAIDSTRWFHTG
jgi:fatty-acyl-CoA synthase